MNKLYLCLIAGFFLIVSLFGEVPEEEILILTEQDVIILPEGKVSATLNEIEAPAELINALQTLEAQEIRKAMPEFNRADTMRISPDGNIARLPDFSQLFAIRLPLAVNRDSAIIMLENLPQIIRGEKNQRGEDFQICPNDTHFNKQWSLHNTGQWGGTPDADIDAAEAWEYSTGSNSIILGIVEGNNADWTHDDFGNKIFGDQYTPGDHTTHVAGIIAAIGNNDLGVAGVDWHARINTQRAQDYGVPEIVQAMNDAVNAGSKAINCSWGMPDYSQNVYDAFVSAYQMGALPVAAMPYPDRNWENPNGFGPWMLAVNASNDDDDFASYTVE